MASDGKPARRPRNRANREGRVYQRSSDKRWVGVVWPPEVMGGRPRYVYGKTREEAKTRKEALEAELADAVPGAAGKDTTLARYLEHWLTKTLPQAVAAGNMAQSTLDSYTDNAEKHILPDLGKITLRHLSVPRIRQWQYDLGRKPSGRPRRKLRKGEKELPPPPVLSPRTVAYCRAILHKALEDAITDQQWGIKENVVGYVRPPKQRRQEIAPPTKDEAAALLASSSNDTLWCYWLIVLALGLRRGEGLGLRWADIDFEKKTAAIQLSIQRMRGAKDARTGRRGAGVLVAKDLKTEASRATVPVPDSMIAALADWRKQQHAMRMQSKAWLAGADLVFTTSVGTALEPRNVNRAWEAVCEKAGVRRLRIHDLRHAWGTYLAPEPGISRKALQAGLRHARSSTTDIYIHVLEEMSRETADAMDGILVDLRGRRRKTS
jgi:integrase